MIKSALLGFIIFLLWVLPAGAVEIDIPGEIGRGEPFWVEMVSDRKPVDIKVSWLDRTFALPVDLPGRQRILLGAGLERRGIYSLELVFYWDDHREKKEFLINVKDKEYPEQHLSLPREMVTPPDEVLERIFRERTRIRSALDTLTPDRLWDGDFAYPVPGEVSSPFGVQRFLNNQPRSAHQGVDFRGAEGTPVAAVADGRVVLTGEFYFGGQTVIVDHGLGVHSLYMHLSEITVDEGDPVNKNQTVGLVGMTGRATGPHLHLGVYVLGDAVDPLYLLSWD